MSNSRKAKLNKRRKYPYLKSAAGTLIENSDNEPVVYKRQLAKGRRNLSAYEPTLASNSSIREIARDNGKLLQFITEPKSIY